MLLKLAIIPVGFSAMLIGVVSAQDQVDMAELIEQALDGVVDFAVDGQPISEAFEIIGEKTGVPMSISADAVRLLPYGSKTRMTARMSGIPLREGLDRLLRPLGMVYVTAADHLEVVPSEELRRIGRRATWEELKSLEWLSNLQWSGSADDIAALKGRLEMLIDEPDADSVLVEAMARSVGGDGVAALSRACDALGWTWYPWGDRIAVVPRSEEIRRALQQTVSLKAEHKPLAQVLTDLSNLAGVPFRYEVGTLGSLPKETLEDFSVLLMNATALQALEVIGAKSGLAFEIENDGVLFYSPGTASGLPAAALTVAPTDDPVIGRVVIPGPDGAFQYEIEIRRSQLPADVRDKVQTRIDEIAAMLRSGTQAKTRQP